MNLQGLKNLQFTKNYNIFRTRLVLTRTDLFHHRYLTANHTTVVKFQSGQSTGHDVIKNITIKDYRELNSSMI